MAQDLGREIVEGSLTRWMAMRAVLLCGAASGCVFLAGCGDGSAGDAGGAAGDASKMGSGGVSAEPGSGGNGNSAGGSGASGGEGASGGNGTGATGAVDPRTNPIEVPAELVPQVDNIGTGPVCSYVDLSSVPVPPNPGYQDESLDQEILSGDDIWETSFYMMLFANCERQARGLVPFVMYSDDKMLALQKTYILKGGHDAFGDRSDITGGATAEGAGGAPFIGATMGNMGLDAGEDNNGNGLWDPHEAGRRPGTGLVDHGAAMVDPDNHCVWASVTIGPTADNYMNAVVFYGTKCDAAE